MKVYVHREGVLEPDAIEVTAETTVADLAGEQGADGVVVLREDDHEALDFELLLTQAGIEDRVHLFAGKVQRLAVEVHFNGVAKQDQFSASQRVEKVFNWAVGKKGFDLSKADAAEHTLALCASGEVPAADVLIGSLPQERPGHLCFNLIPKHRFEG
jgi:hypothetical protein